MSVVRQLFPKPALTKVPKPSVNWAQIATCIHQGITELFQDDMCTDFEIVTDRKTFRCHKVVLASTSDYFKAMFSSGMKETELNKATFTDVSAETFETLFGILYCTDYDKSPLQNKSDREIADLYNLAVRLQIKFLEKICAHHFKSTTNSQNCLNRWKLGKTLLCEEVLIAEIAWDYITHHFTELVNDELLLSLGIDDFKILLSGERLVVPKETVIWSLIKRWIKVSVEKRKAHLETLIKECCLTQIDRDFLMEEVAFDPLVREDKVVSQLVQEAIKFKNHLGSHGNLELKFRSNHGRDQSLVMLYKIYEEATAGHGNGETKPTKLSAWDKRNETWLQWSPFEKAGHYLACCVHAESVFVLTGFYFTYKRAALFEFNGITKKWATHKEMQAPLVGHTLSATNGCIYALGGRAHNHQNFRVHQYSIGKMGDPWRQPGELMASVMYASSVSHGNNIYIFGGDIDGEPADCIQVYDTTTQSGTIYSNLPKPCQWSRALCRASNAYLVTIEGDVIQISLEDGTSILISTIPNFHRTHFGVSLRDGELCVYGGRKVEGHVGAIGDLETSLCIDGHSELADDVFVVDISSGNVAKGESLPEPRDVVCCVDLVHSVVKPN